MNLRMKTDPRDRIENLKIRVEGSKFKKQLSKAELSRIKDLERDADRVKLQKTLLQILVLSLGIVAIYFLTTHL